MLEDIAIMTGGQLVSEDMGIKLEGVTLAMLGRAKKVLITKDDTTIIDGDGSKTDIAARCSQSEVSWSAYSSFCSPTRALRWPFPSSAMIASQDVV